MTNCTHCTQKLIFDQGIKAPSGKVIPLNEDRSYHDCQGKYNNGDTTKSQSSHQSQEQSKLPTFTLYPQLLEIHEEAKRLCLDTYKEGYTTATSDRKLMMVMHWENIISEQRCKKQ